MQVALNTPLTSLRNRTSLWPAWRWRCVKRSRLGKEDPTCLLISPSPCFLRGPGGQSLPGSAPSASARFSGDNAYENTDCCLSMGWNLVNTKKRGEGALTETSFPRLLYAPCAHIYTTWLHHVYNCDQLFTSLFFIGTLGYFCWLVCNGTNAATEPCVSSHGTWSHSLITGQRAVGFSGCYK